MYIVMYIVILNNVYKTNIVDLKVYNKTMKLLRERNI